MNKERLQADWSDVEKSLGLEPEMWRRRIVAINDFIKDTDKSVIDFGAGKMFLKKLLRSDVAYFPVDYVRRSSETIVCDLNKLEFPEVKADVAVCAGILEYLNDPFLFLKKVTTTVKKVIISYKSSEKFPGSAFSTNDIVKFMNNMGFIATGWNKKLSDLWPLLTCFEKVTPDLLKNNYFCTGCGACYNICIHDAIHMEMDDDGFLKPIITSDKCIGCNNCTDICPSINPPINNNYGKKDIKTYALWAKDKIRLKSSSGGVFTTLAEKIIEKGGHVFGARWTEDFYCTHFGVSNSQDLSLLRNSKYVQSNTKETFQEVDKLINMQQFVLYVGCPCQIAGLKAYLGEKSLDDHLITIDLICFCVPPIKAFRKYLDEKYGIQNIKNVIFRDKTLYGWSPTGYKIEFKNGEIKCPTYEEDDYQIAFHNVLVRKEFCEYCQYVGFPRQGDFTMGDFWGIDQHDQSLNDHRGTSVLFINNLKASSFFEEVQNCFQRCERVPIEWALNKGNRLENNGRPAPPTKDYFYSLIKYENFHDSVDKAMKNKHDIGMICLLNHNIGNNLTNLALYYYLKDQGFTVLLINKADDTKLPVINDYFELFLDNPYPSYDIAKHYNNKFAMNELNDICDFFILGSDQLLRAMFVDGMNYHQCMDWVRSDKYKIAYAPSFGTNYFEGSAHQKAKMSYYFRRFQYLSVREKSGVDLLRQEFDLEATWVLDPVFLCDIKYYYQMANKGKIRLPNKKYVGAYILDPNEERSLIIDYLANDKTNGESLAIIDTDGFPDGEYQWNIPTIKNAKVEEWLALIKECDLFITDSFHGLCFALIFNKEFYIVHSQWQWRGVERIRSILSLLGLENRLLEDFEQIKNATKNLGKIDYKKVNEILELQKKHSKSWLEKAIEGRKTFNGTLSEYDLMMDYYINLQNEFQMKLDQEKQNYLTQLQIRDQQIIELINRNLGLKCYEYNSVKSLETEEMLNAIKEYIDSNVDDSGMFILGGLNLDISYYIIIGYKTNKYYYSFTYSDKNVAYRCYVDGQVLFKSEL